MTHQGSLMRSRLFAAIQQDPSIHVRLLACIAGISWTTCDHHVRRLENDGLVSRRLVQGKWCTYARDQVPANQFKVTGLLRDERNQRIVATVANQPGLDQLALSQSMGLARSTLCRRLQILEEAGVVERRRVARERRVFPVLHATMNTKSPNLLEFA